MDNEELKLFTKFLASEKEYQVHDPEVVSMCAMIIMGISCYATQDSFALLAEARVLHGRYKTWKQLYKAVEDFVNEDEESDFTTATAAPPFSKQGEARQGTPVFERG